MIVKVEKSYTKGQSLYENVLKVRGLDDKKVAKIMSANKDDSLSWENLINIGSAVQMLKDNLDKKIGLLVDCDCDGNTATSILYRYIKRVNPLVDITLFFHKGKQHGLDSQVKINDDIELLIIPDAGTSDCKQQKELTEKGIKIIVLDHHLPEKGWEEVENCVVVNNQMSSQYENKSISGAGVVWKFLQGLDKAFGVDYADDYRDLAGLGCLGDIMDGDVLDTRYLMNVAVNLDEVKNLFLRTMIEEKVLKYNKLNLKALAWNVVPCINAVCRMGTLADKQTLFNAMISDDIEVVTEGIKKATSCKGKQDREKKKAIAKVIEYIEEKKLNECPVMVIDVTDLYEGNELSGVVCNSISDMYNRPVIMVGGRGDVYRGSARNCNVIMCENFRGWCQSTGLFDLAQGHSQACGIMLNVANIEKVIEKGKEDFGLPSNKEKVYAVDHEIDFSEVTKKDILQIGKLKDLWGTNLYEPQFVLKNVRINSANVEKLGSRGNVMRFTVDGITFIRLFLSKDFYDKVTMKDTVKFGSVDLNMTVVGKFAINEYNGKQYPQIEIVDIESVKETRAQKTIDDIF